MIQKTENFQKDIVRALRRAGKYNRGVMAQVMALAGALRTLALANSEIDALECTTIKVISRYGNETLAPHPAFKIQKDAQASVTHQMKALGLTTEELTSSDDNDPLIELTKKVKNAGSRHSEIIRPEE